MNIRVYKEIKRQVKIIFIHYLMIAVHYGRFPTSIEFSILKGKWNSKVGIVHFICLNTLRSSGTKHCRCKSGQDLPEAD